jgi:photosystem II stability/assembly factor-like uncharacterized protein
MTDWFTDWAVRSRRLYVRASILLFWVAFLALLLGGCEARLDLSGVDAELARPTHRSDLFQAAAHHYESVVVVGGMGVLLQSPDGGSSWQRSILDGRPFLVDITVCPNGRFYAVEKTDGIWTDQLDGSWTRQALPEMTEPQAIACDNDNGLWVTGGFSTIINSSDDGASWDTFSLDEDLYLTSIQFIDSRHAVVTGEFGTVLMSEDAGSTWLRADDLPESFYPQGAWFNTPDEGWVVGLNGTIWQTTDRAQSWQMMDTGTNAPLYGISGFENTLVAVGDNSTIVYYRMGEPAWNVLDDASQSRTYLRGVTGLGNGQFVVAGGGSLFGITIPDRGALASLEAVGE